MPRSIDELEAAVRMLERAIRHLEKAERSLAACHAQQALDTALARPTGSQKPH